MTFRNLAPSLCRQRAITLIAFMDEARKSLCNGVLLRAENGLKELDRGGKA